MPIYMDVHTIPGVKAGDVAAAHQLDVFHQDEYGCKCLTYWIDEERQNVFCLIDAPDKKIVEELHSRAHGLVPNKVIEVNTSLVASFLGRIYDPEEAEIKDGLKVFHDPSLRVLLVTKTTDPVLLQHCLGEEQANALLARQAELIRQMNRQFGGREVEHPGDGFILSFTSASKAIACALAIQAALDVHDAEVSNFRVALHAGEPVEKSNELFGDTIQMAGQLCRVAKFLQVAVSSAVKELIAKDQHLHRGQNIFSLSPADEASLQVLLNKLEENWQQPEFTVEDYCQEVAMSKSQLYRKTIDLFNLSPNSLLKEYRLERARELMKKRRYTISQITFDSGFTSPSYFTKCFKKKFGLLPMEYIDMLH